MRSLARLIVSRLIGFLVVLIIVGVVNVLASLVEDSLLSDLVGFLNSNLILLFVVLVIFTLSKILWILKFPFSVGAPVLSAIASIFLLTFVFRVFSLIDDLAGVDMVGAFEVFKPFIYGLVFVIVLISGYIRVFSKASRDRERRDIREERKELARERRALNKEKRKHKKAKKRKKK